MLAGPRFALYRRILAGFLSAGFKDHPIEPLAAPVDTEIDHVAHDELWPDPPLPAASAWPHRGPPRSTPPPTTSCGPPCRSPVSTSLPASSRPTKRSAVGS